MDDPSPEIIVTETGRAGLIRLNRPHKLNALTLDMIRGHEAALHRFARNPRIYGVVLEGEGRAFCTGGDIRRAAEDRDYGALFHAEEYQHCWTLECFTKPHISLVDGPVMGGGVGISRYGTHRAMTAAARFAMPEVHIGIFPDVGASWFLRRCPGRTGLYLALTGAVIGAADAYALGLATHLVEAESFPKIRDAVVQGEPIDAVLDTLHVAFGAGELVPHREAIDRLFAGDSLSEIFAALDAEPGEFAADAAAAMRRAAPFSLALTYRLMTAGTMPTPRAALLRDFGLAEAMAHRPDFREGVRAKLIARDGMPAWSGFSPAELNDLWRAGEGETVALVDHWQLVA